jgi:hypothetical protein
MSTSLCGFMCTHTTLSMFEECCERIWLNLVCSVPYGRLCSFLIATGVEKGYWDVFLGNLILVLPSAMSNGFYLQFWIASSDTSPT